MDTRTDSPSTENNRLHWLTLARALLLPTPLLAVDPEGERARALEVQEALEEAGLPRLEPEALNAVNAVARGLERPSDHGDAALHAWLDAIEDAWSLHLGALQGGTAAAGSRPDGARESQKYARNPLSGKVDSTLPLLTSAQAQDCWTSLWPGLRKHLPGAKTGTDWGGQGRNGEDHDQDSPPSYRRLFQTLLIEGSSWTPNNRQRFFLPAHSGLPDHAAVAHRHMTAALLQARRKGDTATLSYFHVGPVQSFISASRRMHDLQVGSYLVVYLTWQAVAFLARKEGPQALVYPSLEQLPLAELELFRIPLPATEPQKRTQQEALLSASIANRFLCLLPEKDAQARLEEAARAVLDRWLALGEAVCAGLERACSGAALPAGWDQGARAQLAQHLEVDAYVQPWPRDPQAAADLLRQVDLDDPLSGLRGKPYGRFFALCQRGLAAHRTALELEPRTGDHRPKCVLCGRLEQLGPLQSTAERHKQQAVSRAFWRTLSEQLQTSHSGKGSESENNDAEAQTSLQLSPGEALCAVCLTKRFAPQYWFGTGAAGFGLEWSNKEDRKRLRFPSLETIASAPLRRRLLEWAEESVAESPDRLKLLRHWLDALAALMDTLDFTPPGHFLTALKSSTPDQALRRSLTELLDQEGSNLYASAYQPETAWRDHKTGDPKPDSNFDRVAELALTAGSRFAALTGALGASASPYLAVVMMDGDDMGQWLSGERAPTWQDLGLSELDRAALKCLGNEKRPLSPSLHGELSRRQGHLAVQKLRKVVDAHLGRLFYSGGDDLLACFPLQTLWAALTELSSVFQSAEGLGSTLTFSAGVAIYHSRMPFQEALEQARAQEHRAKEAGKNQVSLAYEPRSGASLELCLTWEDVKHLPCLLKRLADYKAGARDESGASGTEPDLDIAHQAELEARALGLVQNAPGGAGARSGPDTANNPPTDQVDAFRSRLLYLMGLAKKSSEWNAPELQMLLRREPSGPAQTLRLLKLLRFLNRELHGLPANPSRSCP